MVQPRSTAAGRPSRKQLVVIACLVAFGVVAGAFILRGGAASRPGEGADGHAGHGETARPEGRDDGHGHGHGEEGTGHAQEVPKGPNGGQRFTAGDFGLELLLVEEGGVPRYKAWVYDKDRPAPSEGHDVTLSLARPNGDTQAFTLTPKGGVLTSDRPVPEPRVFEATVAVRTPTAPYLFTFAEMEGKVEMIEAQIQAASISLETSRPASIRSALQFPGEIRFNEDRTAHIVPRVGGVVESVRADLRQKVGRGQVLAVVSSAMVSEMRSELQGAQRRRELARTTYERESIQARPEATWLRVANRGVALPPDALPHLFKRFFRAERSRARSSAHHGLGLAIVAAIARMHGGETSARSADGRTEVSFSVR